MENIGYILLGITVAAWFALVVLGFVTTFPWGLIGFVPIFGVGFLFAKVVKDRIENREDDHYSENVER